MEKEKWEELWQRKIAEAKAHRGKVICPNNLPIRSIKRDWTMLEHEHADHPTYIFPVDVVYTGEGPVDTLIDANGVEHPMPEHMERAMRTQDHALIYTDGYAILTMYECTYALWDRNGNIKAGNLWKRAEWKLTPESLEKVKAYAEKKFPNADW